VVVIDSVFVGVFWVSIVVNWLVFVVAWGFVVGVSVSIGSGDWGFVVRDVSVFLMAGVVSWVGGGEGDD
jgi:hypothetical protein